MPGAAREGSGLRRGEGCEPCPGIAGRSHLREPAALPGDLPHRSARSRGFSARGCGAAFRPPAPSRTGAGRAGELKLCFLPASPRCQRHAQEGGGGGRLQTPRGDPPGRGPVLHQNFHHCPHHGDQLQNRGELRGGDGGWPKMQGKKRAVCTVSVCVCVCVNAERCRPAAPAARATVSAQLPYQTPLR